MMNLLTCSLKKISITKLFTKQFDENYHSPLNLTVSYIISNDLLIP